MKRRDKNSSDSLDLLLDALCNMFGGIIFIALMIVLLTSESSKTTEENTITVGVSREARALQLQVNLLEEKINNLLSKNPNIKNDIKSLFELLEQTHDQKLMAKGAQKRLKNLIKSDTDIVSTAQDELKRLRSLEQTLEGIRENPDNKDVLVATQKEEDSIQELQGSIATLTRRRVVHSRLPRERTSQLGPLWIIVKGSRAFVVTTYNSDFNIYEKRDVTANLGVDSCQFKPVIGGGFVVNKAVSNNPRFIELLNKYSNNTYLATLVVGDEGHEAFQHLRKALVDHGWSYNLSFLNGPLVLKKVNFHDGRIQ